MFRLLACVVAVAALAGPAAFSAAPEDPKTMTIGSIERKDPKLDMLIPKDAKIEVLAGGFKFEFETWPKACHDLVSKKESAR